MARVCIFYTIIYKFDYNQEFNLVISLLINKYTKISFYYAILPLSLAVCLRVKSSEEFLLNVKEIV